MGGVKNKFDIKDSSVLDLKENEIVVRKFLEEFVKNLGFDFSFENVDEVELKDAVIYSFYHDTSKLIDAFKKAF